jgi:hypothetical protein
MTSARGLVEPGSPDAPLLNSRLSTRAADLDRAEPPWNSGFFGWSTRDFFSPVIA